MILNKKNIAYFVVIVAFIGLLWVGARSAPVQKNVSMETPVVYLKDGDTYIMTAGTLEKKIGGKTYHMLAYNGSIPGPTIKVEQGSEITLVLKNETDRDTALHSHGIRLDSRYDGVVGLDQDAIKQGASFTYKIKFPDVGVYWYHPHANEVSGQALGLYGNFMVIPKNRSYWYPVNREVTLAVGDLLVADHDVAAFSVPSNHALMGRYGNILLVNGDTHYDLSANQGEVVRFFVTNVANTRTFNLAIPDAKMKLVGGDNGAYEHEAWVENVVLAPSERAIVEVLFDKPGTYTLEHKTPEKTYALGTIKVSTKVAAPSSRSFFLTLHTNADVVKSIDPFRASFNKPVDKRIALTVDMGSMGAMMGTHRMPNGTMMRGMIMSGADKEKIEWEDTMAMMNSMATVDDVKWKIVDLGTKKSGEDIMWKFKKGDKVKISIFNNPKSPHPMQHPVHFHGQRFLVLSTNGVKNDDLVWKDTVLVQTGDTVEVLVDMNNPGSWMAHCHIAEHLESGMMLDFKVE